MRTSESARHPWRVEPGRPGKNARQARPLAERLGIPVEDVVARWRKGLCYTKDAGWVSRDGRQAAIYAARVAQGLCGMCGGPGPCGCMRGHT